MARLSAIVLALASLADAGPALLARQGITPLSSAQVSAFSPFAWYASAGYCEPASTLAWNCGTNCEANPTFKPVASGGGGGSSQFWFVGVDPTLATVIVSHQGADTSQILPVLTDINFLLESLDRSLFPGLNSSIEAHSGFANEQAQTAIEILAAVQSALSTFGVNKVTMVGHGLGGAISLLDSIYLPLHITGVTFSSVLFGLPRVGNQAFADHASIGSTVTHINNREDVVPILPGMFLGFQHPSGELHILDSGAWVSCPGEDNESFECSTGDVSDIFEGDTSDHDGPYTGTGVVSMGC
ncbi:lipase [Mycena vulgaris]|nr:lipase [Mycena vulgaris]